MELSEMDYEILSMSTEDLNGLWEPIWYFNRKYNKSEEEIYGDVKESIMNLLSKKLIYLCNYNSAEELEVLISEENWEKVLNELSNWKPPNQGNKSHIRFGSSPLGDRTYYIQK